MGLASHFYNKYTLDEALLPTVVPSSSITSPTHTMQSQMSIHLVSNEFQHHNNQTEQEILREENHDNRKARLQLQHYQSDRQNPNATKGSNAQPPNRKRMSRSSTPIHQSIRTHHQPPSVKSPVSTSHAHLSNALHHRPRKPRAKAAISHFVRIRSTETNKRDPTQTSVLSRSERK